MNKTNTTFAQFGLNPQLCAVLSKQHITDPTPIQEQGIPAVLRGEDIVGIAKTGTGKTLAFVLPLMQMMHQKKSANMATTLIVVPTRELAYQVHESCKWFEGLFGIVSTVIVGGAPVHQQIKALQRRPQIVVGTPGRLNDLLKQRKLQLGGTEYIVLDEADRMFDMGFEPQIKEMFRYAPKPEQRQTLLFSATMPASVLGIVQHYMREPVHIEVATHGSTADTVQQEVVVLDEANRKEALLELLDRTKGAVIVFMRTKHHAKKLNRWLRDNGQRSEELHGNLSLAQRKRAVAALQQKRSRILVATDIAGRGIDISHIELVVNYDLPDNPEDYIHRIGRTGRAGKTGRAVSFVRADQAAELRAIQQLINKQITKTTLETVPSAQLQSGGGASQGQGRGRSGYGGARRRSGPGHRPGGRPGGRRPSARRSSR